MNDNEKKLIELKIQNANDLIIDAREFLTILLKIKIEIQRSKGWIFGGLFGSLILTFFPKYKSLVKIKELVKTAKSESIKFKVNLNSIEFKLHFIIYFADLFISSTFVNLFLYRKVHKLKKDMNKLINEFEKEIVLLENEEEKLIQELNQLKNNNTLP